MESSKKKTLLIFSAYFMINVTFKAKKKHQHSQLHLNELT